MLDTVAIIFGLLFVAFLGFISWLADNPSGDIRSPECFGCGARLEDGECPHKGFPECTGRDR